MCALLPIRTQCREHAGELVEPLDTDLGQPKRHTNAIAFVEHPIWQFTAKVRPLVSIDARQCLAAPESGHLQRTSEQRMPAIDNRREPQSVCRMSLVGPGVPGTRRDRRRADRASAPVAPAGQGHSCHGAYRYGPSRSIPAHQREAHVLNAVRGHPDVRLIVCSVAHERSWRIVASNEKSEIL